MPDHFRQQPPQANPVALVAPRSPPEHPLSLVIGKRGHDDHHHPGQTPPHHRHSRDTPPPTSPSQSKGSSRSTAEEDERCPPPAHVHPHHMHAVDEDKQAPQQAHQSPGRSSGFSEHHSSPEHIPDMPENNLTGTPEEAAGATGGEEDIPLALVVPKGGVAGGDSGHEDDFSGGESSPTQGTTPPLPMSARHENSYVVGRQQDIRRSRLSHPGALVVDKVPVGDDDAVLNHSLKIRDFARMTEEARQHHPQQHPAGLAGTKRLSTTGSHHGKPHILDHMSDTASVSSIDTWGSSLADVRSAMSGTFPRAMHPAARRKSRANSAGGIATSGGGAMGAPIYSCQYCDKSFVNKYHLASHVVTHTGERNFACTHCNKTFGRKSTLRAHMTTHTKSSNFMCPLCKKACNDNNSLEEHIRMHTGEKPFVCGVCSKAYARKSHLNVHYRVHTGERPFVCVDCGKDFTEKRFLNDHMQTAHSGGGDDGPLRCPNCFREFAYKTSLKQHLKKQMCVKNINRAQGQGSHGPHPKQFQCPFCEKSYSWKQTLKQHVSMYHRNKVHTDEFWKYELAKHRRGAGLDSGANDDLWKQQLGKHGEEAERRSSQNDKMGQAAVTDAAATANGRVDDRSHEEKWLEQIHRVNEGEKAEITPVPGSKQHKEVVQPQNDVKLMALQSLQLLKMGMNQQKKPGSEEDKRSNSNTLADNNNNNDGAAPAVVDALKTPGPPEGSKETNNNQDEKQQDYLDFLAQVHLQRETRIREEEKERDGVSKEREIRAVTPPSGSPHNAPTTDLAPVHRQLLRPEQTSTSSSTPSMSMSSAPTAVLPEECAVKRTQMWLAQLGQYRQRSLLQEEMDRNHDELWEEQIARAKKNPVRSPLEKEEEVIMLDNMRGGFGERRASSNEYFASAKRAYNGQDQANYARYPHTLPPPPSLLPQSEDRPKMVPLMSALQVTRHPSPCPPTLVAPPRPKSPPSATITRPPSDTQPPAIIMPKPKFPDFKKAFEEASAKDKQKKLTLSLENDIHSDVSSPREPIRRKSDEEEEKEKEKDMAEDTENGKKAHPAKEDASVLKSILLDRFSRKRPCEELPPPPRRTQSLAMLQQPQSFIKQPDSKLMRPSVELSYQIPPATIHPPTPLSPANQESSHDILRRRLLGLKDPLPEPTLPKQPQPRQPEQEQPTATKTVEAFRGSHHHLLVPAPTRPTYGAAHTHSSYLLPHTQSSQSFSSSFSAAALLAKNPPLSKSPVAKDAPSGSPAPNPPLATSTPLKANYDLCDRKRKDHPPASIQGNKNGDESTTDHGDGKKSSGGDANRKNSVDQVKKTDDGEAKKEAKEDKLSMYAHTSVLKHLLYRYTESTNAS